MANLTIDSSITEAYHSSALHLCIVVKVPLIQLPDPQIAVKVTMREVITRDTKITALSKQPLLVGSKALYIRTLCRGAVFFRLF